MVPETAPATRRIGTDVVNSPMNIPTMTPISPPEEHAESTNSDDLLAFFRVHDAWRLCGRT